MEETLTFLEMPWIIVRPSSVTGVGEQEQHLIPKLIKSCLDGVEMPFVGEPTHDYIDVEDFVKGVMYLTENINKYRNQTFQISSGISYSNEDVKNMVESITGKEANIKRVENMRKYDTEKWIVKPTLEFSQRPLYLSISEMVNEYTRKKNY